MKGKYLMKSLKIKCICPTCDLKAETPIYRYFSFDKFEKMLSDNALYFCNIKKFADKNERQIPKSYYQGWREEAQITQDKIIKFKECFFPAYISCWTLQKDNYAFWKIYDPNNNGCMIESTFGLLKEQLEKENVVFYKVQYVNPNRTDEKCSPPLICFEENNDKVMIPRIKLGTEALKIFPYKYEDELRAVFYSMETTDGENIHVDVQKLVKCVMISPFANEKKAEDILKIIKSKLSDAKILSSIIVEQE